MDPSLFYPERGESRGAWRTEIAVVCGGCPVRTECLDYSTLYERDGYWANTSPEERRALRRELGVKAQVPGASISGQFFDLEVRRERRERAEALRR
jgi:WhiB family redox-sensing transcriptional regulator